MSTTRRGIQIRLRTDAVSAAQRIGRDGSALPQQGRWYVLHTRSRQEKSLSDELSILGIGHFLPLTHQVRFYGKRKADVDLPLFPGYVFLRGSLEEAYAASRTRRVARIIHVADQDHITWELTNLRMALGSHLPLNLYPFLKKGLRVAVKSGPLCGLQGFIESHLGDGRLILHVDILGQAVSVEVEGAQLELV